MYANNSCIQSIKETTIVSPCSLSATTIQLHRKKCHAHIAQALIMLHNNAAAHSVLGLNVSHVKGVMMCNAQGSRGYVMDVLTSSMYTGKMTHRHYIHLPAG